MSKTKAEAPSFEEALAQLESIVDSMESGGVPLAELLSRFEQGTKLLHHCEGKLKNAELRIEKLQQNKDGDATFTSFETTESVD